MIRTYRFLSGQQDLYFFQLLSNFKIFMGILKKRSVLFAALLSISMHFVARSQDIKSSSALSAGIKYIQVDSLKIAYKIIGKGQPILFLQRFRGTINDWDPAFVDAVAKQYKVILFDAPGVGLSSGSVPASITKMADQAVVFSRALGINQAVVLGWSMGGAVGQVLTINHPEFVSKLILLATGPSTNPEFVAGSPEFGIRARKPEYAFEDNQFLFFYKSPASKAACEAYLQRVGSYKAKDPATRPESFANQSAALGEFKANKEKNYFEELKNIKQPVLIANGKFDPSYPLINSSVLAREINNAKLIIYPGAGHGFLFQCYKEFVPEIFAFLSVQ